MPLRIGETFAGYSVLRFLGSGGMGEVYVVRHPRLPRQEALKVLRPEVSRDYSFRERFIREADLAAGLRHPHIVGIHDRGEHDGQLWITMDYIDGTDAAQLMQQRYPSGAPVGLATHAVAAVASALDYAHSRGLLHRDVKPANIIIAELDTDDPSVFLADFGIARPVDEISGITTTNMTVGTVAYAAPEQLIGDDVDGRADQYALAATAYHLLTGVQLYPHSNPAVVISRHLTAVPPRLSDTRQDLASFDSTLSIALSKDPRARFNRCADFARAMAESLGLTAAYEHSPIAPTTSAPAFAVGLSPTAPTESAPTRAYSPTHASQSTDAASPRRLRTALMVAAAVALIVASTGIVIWKPWAHDPGAGRSASPGATNTGSNNTGPLTGLYTAGFGPELQLGDRKVLHPEPARGTFEIRSTCTPSGCIAVANAADGPTINRKFIFDDVGTEWISVSTAPSNSPAVSAGMHAGCEQGLSPETWETLILRPTPSGDLTGQYEVFNANNCNTSRNG